MSDVHIFASVPLSARRFPLPDPVPRGRPARRKSSRHPPRNPPRNTITHGSHGPLFMQTTMHTKRRHEPYTLLKSLCQTMSDGSAVTGRQYRDPCVRGVSWSLGRWGVEQAATKNKHLGVPGRPSGWTCREVSTLVCRECMVECGRLSVVSSGRASRVGCRAWWLVPQ